MTWNTNITEAQTGDYVWLALPCGRVVRSWWVKTKRYGGHFIGVDPQETPIAWMPYPQKPIHPFEAAPGEAAVTSGNVLRKPAAAERGQNIREGDAPRETDRASGDASCPDTIHPFELAKQEESAS